MLFKAARTRLRTREEARGLRLPLAFFGVTCAAMAGAILLCTGGTFVYTLDDPYIHLALAEEIARGHYGINPAAFAAPSSSLLWPFLLAPWARLPGAALVPLLYNLLVGVGVVIIYQRVLVRALRPGDSPKGWTLVALAGVGLVLATNLVGLVFTGMEHTLQVLMAVLAVEGLWKERESGIVPRWLVVVLVLGPLVRYENLAVSGPALAYLFARGHRRSAVGAGVVIVALLGAFSLFLLAHDAGLLPSSVEAKSTLDDGWHGVASGVIRNLHWGQGRVLAVGLLPLLVVAVSQRRARPERWLACALTATVALHLVGGRFGWQSRYEIYAWAAVLVGLVLLYGSEIRHFVDREPVWKPALLTAVAVGALGIQYLRDGALLPLAAQNIYEQQFQMHRFLAYYYPGPVAVNDLGLTSFRNDHLVLDLYGLGSHEALALRTTEPDSHWITPLADEQGVRLAMVYHEWFPDFPAEWVRLGVLTRRGRLVSSGSNEVFVYARNQAAADAARPALRAWAASLPPGTGFSFSEEE